MSQTDYFRKLIIQKNNYEFLSDIRAAMYPVIDKNTDTYWLSDGREFVLLFILNGSLSILEHWIVNGCKERPEEISHVISSLCSNISIKHDNRK